MPAWNYYNDNDPGACAWIRELIRAGLVPDGEVDDRPIETVAADDIRGFRQCHFFAGILGWPLALALAGWPTDRPAWSGSCPCQPFSGAGKGAGFADPRHLWPSFYRLIRECRPATVFGEQVSSPLGREWLAGVFADLEGSSYAVAGADLPAAGVGAPHIRQRLWWVADSQSAGRWTDAGAICSSATEGLRATEGQDGRRAFEQAGRASDSGSNCGLAHLPGERRNGATAAAQQTGRGLVETDGAAGGDSWNDFQWIPCLDGKSRRIESGLTPLVARVPPDLGSGGYSGVANGEATSEARVARLRGYGNSIVPPLAAVFIKAFLETEQ